MSDDPRRSAEYRRIQAARDAAYANTEAGRREADDRARREAAAREAASVEAANRAQQQHATAMENQRRNSQSMGPASQRVQQMSDEDLQRHASHSNPRVREGAEREINRRAAERAMNTNAPESEPSGIPDPADIEGNRVILRDLPVGDRMQIGDYLVEAWRGAPGTAPREFKVWGPRQAQDHGTLNPNRAEMAYGQSFGSGQSVAEMIAHESRGGNVLPNDLTQASIEDLNAAYADAEQRRNQPMMRMIAAERARRRREEVQQQQHRENMSDEETRSLLNSPDSSVRESAQAELDRRAREQQAATDSTPDDFDGGTIRNGLQQRLSSSGSGRITGSQVRPGDALRIEITGDGAARPTSRRGQGTEIAHVTNVESTLTPQRSGYSSRSRAARREYHVTLQRDDGTTVQTTVSPATTFAIDQDATVERHRQLNAVHQAITEEPPISAPEPLPTPADQTQDQRRLAFASQASPNDYGTGVAIRDYLEMRDSIGNGTFERYTTEDVDRLRNDLTNRGLVPVQIATIWRNYQSSDPTIHERGQRLLNQLTRELSGDTAGIDPEERLVDANGDTHLPEVPDAAPPIAPTRPARRAGLNVRTDDGYASRPISGPIATNLLRNRVDLIAHPSSGFSVSNDRRSGGLIVRLGRFVDPEKRDATEKLFRDQGYEVERTDHYGGTIFKVTNHPSTLQYAAETIAPVERVTRANRPQMIQRFMQDAARVPGTFLSGDEQSFKLGRAAFSHKMPGLVNKDNGKTANFETKVTAVNGYSGRMTVSGKIYANGMRVGYFTRTFSQIRGSDGETKTKVYHDIMVIENDEYQGFGYATEFLARTEAYYRTHGVDVIGVTAAGSGGYRASGYNGAFTWAGQGFNWADPSSGARAYLPMLSRDDRYGLRARYPNITESEWQSLVDWINSDTPPSAYDLSRWMQDSEHKNVRLGSDGKSEPTWPGKDLMILTTWSGMNWLKPYEQEAK